MKYFKGLFQAGAVMALVTTLHAGGEGWVSDFEAAKAQAAKEGKDLLIDFTGSDWCGWCIKLNKEVFVHDEFKAGVKDKFVLVELDFPRDKSKIAPEKLESNKQLAKDYAVRGYPTIMLADAHGRPYAKTGYRAGGPANYVTHLNELIAGRAARDEAFAAAAKLEGVEKAKALIKALESIGIDETLIDRFYGDISGQIKAADVKDETGYLKGLQRKQRIEEFREKLNEKTNARDMEGAITLTDAMIAEPDFTPTQRQQFIMTKAMILANIRRYDESIQQIDKALEVAPEGEGNENIRMMRKRIEIAKTKLQEAEEKAKQNPQPKPEEKPAPKPEEKPAPKAE